MSKHHNQTQQQGKKPDIADHVADGVVKAIETDGKILTTAELQKTIDDMRKGQATKNKILDFLIKRIGFIHLRDLIYHLPTVCTPQEVNQCFDFLAARLDPRDVNLLESHRRERCEEAAVRIEAEKVKKEALEEYAKQG